VSTGTPRGVKLRASFPSLTQGAPEKPGPYGKGLPHPALRAETAVRRPGGAPPGSPGPAEDCAESHVPATGERVRTAQALRAHRAAEKPIATACSSSRKNTRWSGLILRAVADSRWWKWRVVEQPTRRICSSWEQYAQAARSG